MDLQLLLGALLDGIPESVAIGLTMISGGAVGIATVVAVFISNIPEGLSSSVGMKSMGWSKKTIFRFVVFNCNNNRVVFIGRLQCF